MLTGFVTDVATWLRKDSIQLAGMLIVIAVLASFTGLLVRLDYLLFDSGQRLRPGIVPDDVVIVAIDQRSLDRIGRWPWSREVHTKLLNRICIEGPRAIGFDIAFAEPSGRPSSDSQFADAVHRCGNVVLPLLIETSSVGAQVKETPPIPVLRKAAAGIGRVGVHLDEDGIARSVSLYEGVGGTLWPLFAQELLRVAANDRAILQRKEVKDVAPKSSQLLGEGVRRIDFIGPAGTVRQISYEEVVNGQFLPGFFAGKTIVVGTTAVGLGDFLSTPTSGLAQPMPGVEVQANVLLGLREGRLIKAVPVPLQVSGTVLFSLMPLLWLPRLMPLAALLFTTLWFGTLWLAFAACPVYVHYWFSPGGALLATMVSFPLWSLRRLESARRHLDQELQQLRSNLPVDSRVLAPKSKFQISGFEQRISWVQDAQRVLKRHEEQRNETLAFISHDLRVPISSAIQVLESEYSPKVEQVLPPLRRALRMAQDFMLLARAEALELSRMQELDLLAILHQAADELYPLSQQCGVQIGRQLPTETAWIQGDFDSLERATINLLHNAITHAPLGSHVGLGMERHGTLISFFIENDGMPLTSTQIERLFQRFSRCEEAAHARSSTGLGLYFVRTVVERHGGQVGVEFPKGLVRFRVTLPLRETGLPT